MQQRAKWHIPNESLREGDLVIIKDLQVHPLHWPLARIIKLFPGKDGLVRVANLKTSSGEFQRPIVSLIRLPIDVAAKEIYQQKKEEIK